MPELYHLVNLPQEKDFHEFDGWYHTLAVVSHTEPDLVLRWGALLHDVAKGMPAVRAVINGRLTDRGHDTLGAEMAETLLTRLGYPEAFVKRVAWIVKNHMRFHLFVQMAMQMRKNGFARKPVVVNSEIAKLCALHGSN